MGRKLLKINDVESTPKASKVQELELCMTRANASLLPTGQAETAFRFSGHQTFPLRITWIPIAVAELAAGRDPLTDIDEGITKLGLGKNMVEALRCWIEAFQVANKTENRWELTPMGLLVFDPKTGADPFLEDHPTAWLLH